MKKVAITLTLLCVAAFAQQKGTLKDTRDNKTYKTVKIGDQTWLAENLNYAAKGSKCGGATPKTETFEITEMTEFGQVIKSGKQTRKYFALEDNNTATCNKYGRLYDYETAMGACPKGWHLPVKAEWEYLVKFVGDNEAIKTDYERRSQGGKFLRAKSGWTEKNGEDKYGFTALPGGSGDSATYGSNPGKLEFNHAGTSGLWLSATVENGKVYMVYMHGRDDGIGGGSGGSKNEFVSVRCAQGASAEEALAAIEKAEADRKEAAERAAVESAIGKQFNPNINYGSITDARDKKTYKTTKISNQTWLAENLNYEAKGSKCFNDKDYYCKRDGRLYDWETAKTACPAGWHLPSIAEWEALGGAVGGLKESGKKLKSTNGGWIERNGKNPINGTDDFGFSALWPTNNSNGRDFGCMWWSASESKRAQEGQVSRIFSDKLDDQLRFDDEKKTYFFGVRCVQGDAPKEEPAAKPAEQPKQPAQPAQPAAKEQPKQQSANEFCNITFPKKACVSMPKGTCKMSGGKVVDKCP